jgi:chromosomal replication initiation ATPase DnaA
MKTSAKQADMARWKPNPPPRETVEELKAAVATNKLVLARLEAAVDAAAAKIAEPKPVQDCNLHFDAICKAVCDDFGVDLERLEGRGRYPRVVAARRALVWLARKRTLLSFPEICKSMGRNEGGHSTMVEQFYTVVEMMDKPMYPGTKETFGEYFVRFGKRAWGFKPRSPSVATPPAVPKT